MSQQIQLRQNSHLTDLLSILKNFQSSDIMVDVTLSCEGHNIKAHKLILSACSPYFESLFTENPCQHPIVIMNGMKFEVLHAVMDFIYKGDVYIARDTLPEFLKAAKTLQVKGLETFSNTQHPIKTTQHPIKTTQNTEPPAAVNEQNFQRSPTPIKKRKRSLSDSAKSDEDVVVKEEPLSPEVVVKEEPLSPEIHDLSGDEYFSMPRMKSGESSSNSHVPKMNPFFSQQSTQYIVREPESDEEYESSSELLRQTLTTKNVASKNDIGFTSSDNMRIDKRVKVTSDTDSSNMQGRSESPLDEKPIIQFQDSPEISPERAMALYEEQSFHQPGPSNYKDGSLIQQKSSQAQDENVEEEEFSDLNEEDLESLGFKLGDRKKIMSIIRQNRQNDEYASAFVSERVKRPSETNTSIESDDGILLEDVQVSEANSNLTLNSEKEMNASTSIPESSANFYKIVAYSCPEVIDVQAILKKSPRGKMLLQLFHKPDSEINKTCVNQLVRICVHAMVTDLENLYPTSLQKQNLAKAIVQAFPILKSSREKVEGHEHFFDAVSRSGLIEWRLKTLRTKLPPSKRKNRRRRTNPTSTKIKTEFEEVDLSLAAKITWLQYQVPSSLHKAEIMEAMQETFKMRRNFIKKENPSLSEILRKYPKFKNFGGILLDAEFKQLHPEAGDFLASFPSHYGPRILKYTRQNRKDVFERLFIDVDENFSALLMLADLLSATGVSKKRKVSDSQNMAASLFPADGFVRFIGVNRCIEEVLATITESQPYLLCVGDKNSIGKFFLILNKEAVDIGNNALKAFDFLYKCHYVFNVKFSSQLASFYNFMDCIIYKIVDGPARSSAENLNNILNALDV